MEDIGREIFTVLRATPGVGVQLTAGFHRRLPDAVAGHLDPDAVVLVQYVEDGQLRSSRDPSVGRERASLVVAQTVLLPQPVAVIPRAQPVQIDCVVGREQVNVLPLREEIILAVRIFRVDAPADTAELPPLPADLRGRWGRYRHPSRRAGRVGAVTSRDVFTKVVGGEPGEPPAVRRSPGRAKGGSGGRLFGVLSDEVDVLYDLAMIGTFVGVVVKGECSRVQYDGAT